MRIAVFGLGYVGTVTAAGLASRGHVVCGVDVDEVKVGLIRQGRSPVVEPGLDDLVAAGVAAGALTATTDAVQALEGADVSLLCVGTPSTPQGSTDLSYLRRALDDIRAALAVARPSASGFHAVVVRSTVPPGTGDEMVAPTFADVPAGADWEVGTAMCPEFLREGSGVADFFDPPFVVLGAADPRVAQTLTAMFGFLDRTPRLVDVRSAEALKYACNAFHATKVSFANEMGRVFRTYGVDAREVMEIFCEDRTLNISPAYLRPGFAFGGSCLPKDLRAITYRAKQLDVETPVLSAALESNRRQIEKAYEMVLATGSRRVGVLGLAFKAGTDDLRESPMVSLVEMLIGKGLQLAVYDRDVRSARLVGANKEYVEREIPHIWELMKGSVDDVLAHADTVVIGNGASEFRQIEPRLRDGQMVVDLVRAFGGRTSNGDGYQGICW
jgi:GDP-mannose 6-dehydrogenase